MTISEPDFASFLNSFYDSTAGILSANTATNYIITPQMLRGFRSRFGDDVAILHSALGQGEKFDEWRKCLTGEAKVVLGARSAIFAPLKVSCPPLCGGGIKREPGESPGQFPLL